MIILYILLLGYKDRNDALYTFGDLKCRFFSKKNKQKFDFEVSKNNLYTTFYPLFKVVVVIYFRPI